MNIELEEIIVFDIQDTDLQLSAGGQQDKAFSWSAPCSHCSAC